MSVASFAVSALPAAATASVPQRSPLRWPGGKSWLIPHVRCWLSGGSAATLVEPFAGGASVSLTAVVERLVERAVLVDVDVDLAAFWTVALTDPAALVDRISSFTPTVEAVRNVQGSVPVTDRDRAWRTLVLNRTRHGGIIAAGAGLIGLGEDGRGVASRWYPETLIARIEEIGRHAGRIAFHQGDALSLLPTLVERAEAPVAVFCDPPYGGEAGASSRRLYTHSDVNYADLFELVHDIGADFLITLDMSAEVERLVRCHGFCAVTVLPRNRSNAAGQEVIISPQPLFCAEAV